MVGQRGGQYLMRMVKLIKVLEKYMIFATKTLFSGFCVQNLPLLEGRFKKHGVSCLNEKWIL